MTLLACFLLISSLPLLSDNTSSAVDTSTSFYPLHIGDVWRYTQVITAGGGPPVLVNDVDARIERDTLITSKTYFIIEYFGYLATDFGGQSLFERRILARFDTTTGNFYKYDLNLGTDVLLDSSHCATPGAYPWGTLSIQPYDYVLAHAAPSRTVVNGYPTNKWTRGIGRSYASNIGFRASAHLSVNHARIDGIEYDTTTTAVRSDSTKYISPVLLDQNHPNPFFSMTTISYSLTSPSDVRLTVYDILGRKVADLAVGVQGFGSHQATFNSSSLPNGVYFYRLETGHSNLVRKMTLVR